MRISGVDPNELAQIYGTPLLVFNVDAVDAAIAALHVACDRYGVEISYAAKAFLCLEFARHLAHRPGLGLDVCSMGELVTAERAGFSPARLTLHGAGKSDAELRAAVEGRVGRIVVDGIDELRRLASLANADVNVVLRLNTGIEAHTHAFVRTGGSDTKFGIVQRDETAAVDLLRSHPHLRFTGLHAHVGSQIHESAPFVANSHALIEAAARFAAHGFVAACAIVGGGFGDELDLAATISDVARCVRECASDLGMEQPRIGIEPGRAVVGAAGTTLYRAIAVKDQNERRFVIVDGGLFENPRPALYDARHEIGAVEPHPGGVRETTVCGRSCENDELVKAALPESVRAGDLLAMYATGAYTFSMAGNYNRFARPAVVAVQAGSHRLWVRRESLDDVLGRDVDA